MKNVFIAAVVTAAFSFNASAALDSSAKKVKYVGDTEFASFCKAAVNNDADLFKRSVSRQVGVIANSKQRVLDLVLNAENVSCSGQGLEDFSESRGATNVVEFIKSIK